MRPLEGEWHRRDRLGIPIRAYLAGVYGDRPPPRLAVDVAEDLAFDWMTETVLLQIVHEALHDVWRHSHAGTVEVAIHAAGDRVALQVTDDGVGFDPPSSPEVSALRVVSNRRARAVRRPGCPPGGA